MELILTIAIITVVAIGVWLIYELIFTGSHSHYHSTHEHMIKTYCENYKNATFEDFIIEFKKRDGDWMRSHAYPESFFSKSDHWNNRIHASIIMFNGVGMMLDKDSYRKFEEFIKKNKYIVPSMGKWER